MRSWRTSTRIRPSRRAALAAVAGVALAGTAAGVATAEISGPAATARPALIANRATITGPASTGQRRPAGQPPGQPQTSCRRVLHIGDSTSVDLISPQSLPRTSQRLPAQYAKAGVRHLKLDASGGRSIVEALPGQANGYRVASAWRSAGYAGCWVFALGTNDAANIAAGSTVGMAARISELMAVAHGQPVLWVNTRTTLTAGPWANASEQRWDLALVNALHRYPNMRIFDWSAIARPSWFLPDGIHYNPAGCAIRAKAIARALARAFPLNGHSNGQLVR